MGFRALTLAALFAVWPAMAPGQTPGVLHVRITLTDAARGSVPIARYALLISDNPSTTSPLRVVTGTDGTVAVKLRPGNYTVESDEPLAFGGKGYQWTQTLDIAAGRDVVLELSAANAEIVAAPAASSSQESWASGSLLLQQWNDSVVAVWTPESHASGFLVRADGLVVTNQRVIGGASAVEVQLTPSLKVAARVLAADRTRDVAVLWIDPAITASRQPVPLHCDDASQSSIANGQRLVALGVPLSGPKEWSPGDVVRVEPSGTVADFRLAPGSTGGPVFGTGGAVLGISSVVEDQDERKRRDARVVPIGDACEVVRSAEKAMQAAERPAAAHLPVEPLRPFPAGALDAAVRRRGGDLNPYQTSSQDFDVAFLTPVLVHAAQQNRQGKQSETADFGEWSEYFADDPAVLVVRVTPKLAEGFWTTIARGAAYTQGVALPPIKRFKPGFLRLQAFCGDAEVAPIHPFVLQRRVSETDAIREGLYVFDPQAFGPQCGSVKLVLYSEKAPKKPETRAVDPQILERIRQDFAP